MRTVFKFKIEPLTETEVKMPKGARLLSVGAQGKDVVVWAAVDPDGEYAVRKVLLTGTGFQVSGDFGIFIGTVQITTDFGEMVFHAFDMGWKV